MATVCGAGMPWYGYVIVGVPLVTVAWFALYTWRNR